MASALRLIVRTPHAVVIDEAFDAIRVPTESGQVGLERGSEPAVLVFEAGVMLLRRGAAVRFLATAGGLLRGSRGEIEAFTPIALLGENAADLRARLDQALEAPSEENALRRELGRLETEILRELRHREGAPLRAVRAR